MDDRSLVAAMTRGDPVGLDGAYRRYAARLYTYCRGLLRDGDAAADAVHDTFVIAGQRAGDLRDPERLRAWLYAIARNECLRILRTRTRSAPLEAAGEVAAETIDLAAAVHAEHVRELVQSAAESLSPGDREVIELAVRHTLAPSEIAATLGVPANHAHARISRAREQLLQSLGALLIARAPNRCPERSELLAGWDGQLTALLRKRINRHVKDCPTCANHRQELLQPAALLTSYATIPWLPLPALLWPRIRDDIAFTRTSATSAVPLDQHGFPKPHQGTRCRSATAAVLLVLLLTGGAVIAVAVSAPSPGADWVGAAATPREPGTPLDFGSGSPPGAATASPPGGTTNGPANAATGGPNPGIGNPGTGGDAGSDDTPEPRVSGSASPRVRTDPSRAGPPSPPPSPRPSRSTAGAIVVGFSGTATARTICGGSTFRLAVTFTANAPLRAATLLRKDTFNRRDGMDVSGRTATLGVGPLSRATQWWVRATRASDGATFTTPVQTAANPC